METQTQSSVKPAAITRTAQQPLQFHPNLFQSWKEPAATTRTTNNNMSSTNVRADAATLPFATQVRTNVDTHDASKIIKIESASNLRLVVGMEVNRIVFLVSRDTMYNNCPTLFTDPSVLAKPDTTEISIFDQYDWDAKPLEIILNIAHDHVARLPRSITFRTLAQLSGLAESCKLEAFLQPFLSGWIKCLIPHALAFNDNFWLHIAWTFRLRGLFAFLVQYAIDHSELSESQLKLDDESCIVDCLPQECEKYLYGEYLNALPCSSQNLTLN
jgi:hypothetical protein